MHRRIYWIGFVFFLAVVINTPSFAEPEDKQALSTPEELTEYSKLRQSIEATIESEKQQLSRFEKELFEINHVEQVIIAEMNATRIQLSAHANLLLLPSTQIEDLEKAWLDHRTSIEKISEYLKDISQKQVSVETIRQQTSDQLAINEKQLSSFKVDHERTLLDDNLLKKLDTTIELISKKQETLNSIHETHTRMIKLLNETKDSLMAFSNKFDQQIKEKKREALFRRKDTPLMVFNSDQIRQDVLTLGTQIQLWLTPEFWIRQVENIWKSGIYIFFSSLILFIFIQILLYRFRGFCFQIDKTHELETHYPWLSIGLKIFQRSILLLGTVLFIYIFARVRGVYSSVFFIRPLVHILSIVLFCGWIGDFLKNWKNDQFTSDLKDLLLNLLRFIRTASIIYVVLSAMSGNMSTLLPFIRVIFEATLLLWTLFFWKTVYKQMPFHPSYLLRSLMFVNYAIVSGGIIVEFAGYGRLAIYWYASWGKTLAVLMWGGLCFQMIREWSRIYRQQLEKAKETTISQVGSFHWLMIQLSWLLLFCIFIICILFSWGSTLGMVVTIFKFLRQPIPLGGMSLSLLGFIFAIVILIFTQAALRIWKETLMPKLLSDSGLNVGVKDSITTITIYVFWTFGILIALHIIGISTTSITVAFGALGIGLGFGLQNIFNNFISGIILLFERPIQVGDAVEINGTWAEVRKINVRSTVVQTYDNATLIIPNSDFISSQVTNWSFKDPRVRRQITIGVAYGSDTELVRKTLLEIAQRTAYVLESPPPSVLFVDFADSALIFRLRIWTDVDNCLTVETNIRFEIDRVFRERNISIPFPQRDVHIYHAAKEAPISET